MASPDVDPPLHDRPKPLRMTGRTRRERPALKTSYHHGELRQALIDAARLLIREREGNDFSLSDACRRAGVSTAAPYRHFADKTEIMNEVVAQGFADLTERFRGAVKDFAPGTRDRILAIGYIYLTFAMAEPALFRMMFSQSAALPEGHVVTRNGKTCFDVVVQEVVDYCTINRVDGDAQMIALQLWTMVHGASSLTIDGDYAKVAPHVDATRLIASAAERLLFLLPQGPAA